MKQKLCIILVFLTVFIVFSMFLLSENVALAKDKSGEEELADSVDDGVSKLDTDSLQEYFDSLTEDEKAFLSDDVKAFIKSVIDGGDKPDFQQLVNVVFKRIVSGVLGFLPAVLSVIIISVLYGMLSGLNSGFLNESTNKIVYFACYGAALVILLNEVIGIINVTSGAANGLTKFMQVIFPLLLTLSVALGGVTTVGFLRPLMAVAATFFASFITSFIIPCFAASVILAVVGNLSPTVKLEKLSAFIRKVAEWSLGLIFGAFITVLTTRGIVGRTADGIAVNAAKFAIGSYVPILGGYVSDGFDVVMASCVLIKNALGVTGLIVMLSVMLAPMLKLIAFSFAMKFAAAVTETAGGGKISELLSGISKSAGLLIASLTGLCFVFFVVVMTVISAGNLGVA